MKFELMDGLGKSRREAALTALPWPDRPALPWPGPAALPWPGPAALPWPGPAALPWPGPAALPWADLPTAALAVIAGSHAAEWRHGSRRKDPRLQRAQAGATAAFADTRARRRAR